MIEEIKKEVQMKALNRKDMERFHAYINRYENQLRQLKELGCPTSEPKYIQVEQELERYHYCLYTAEKKAPFIRKNKAADIRYRDQQIEGFCQKVLRTIPEDSDLRFHGTPIYLAKEIIASQKISSVAERFNGYVHSTDLYGEISVSDRNTLSRTVAFFLDMTAYHWCLPCGCLFVLSGAGQTEEQKRVSVMSSVNFLEEPDRLKKIVTTPENIKRVKKWTEQSGLKGAVCSFDEF